MKFGDYLKERKNPEWSTSYLDYDKLKSMISDLMEAHVGAAHDTGMSRLTYIYVLYVHVFIHIHKCAYTNMQICTCRNSYLCCINHKHMCKCIHVHAHMLTHT